MLRLYASIHYPTGAVTTTNNLRLKKKSENKETQDKMKSFFENKLLEVVRVDPILDEQEKTWIYSEEDTWPNRNWAGADWLQIFVDQTESIRKRLNRSSHYENLEAEFERLFEKEDCWRCFYKQKSKFLGSKQKIEKRNWRNKNLLSNIWGVFGPKNWLPNKMPHSGLHRN